MDRSVSASLLDDGASDCDRREEHEDRRQELHTSAGWWRCLDRLEVYGQEVYSPHGQDTPEESDEVYRRWGSMPKQSDWSHWLTGDGWGFERQEQAKAKQSKDQRNDDVPASPRVLDIPVGKRIQDRHDWGDQDDIPKIVNASQALTDELAAIIGIQT